MISNEANQLLNAFNTASGWEQRMRLVMQYGQALPKLAEDKKIERHKIHGCESQVWLISDYNEGIWQFQADSDARIVKGLLALILTRTNGLTTEQLQLLDLEAWFIQLGLAKQLSSSRRGGLQAIFTYIKTLPH